MSEEVDLGRGRFLGAAAMMIAVTQLIGVDSANDLIDGSITYDPEPPERPGPGNVLVCCSQPNASVTLDL